MATVTENFLMGTQNGPDGTKHTVQFCLEVGGSRLWLFDSDSIVALAEWVKTSAAYMDDVAQQAHGWTTPASCPVFGCKAEEDLELMEWRKSKKSS